MTVESDDGEEVAWGAVTKLTISRSADTYMWMTDNHCRIGLKSNIFCNQSEKKPKNGIEP